MKKNRKGNHRQRYNDDAYLLMFVAGLDEWLGSAQIHELFPKFPKDKVRRIRRLTYTARVDQMIRDTLPADIAVPQEWHRYKPGQPDSNSSIANQRNLRPCPSLDVLADRLDSLRVDGLKTIRYWIKTT